MAITAGGTGYAGAWTDVYILRRFVEMLKDELLFSRFSEPATVPKHTGGYVARWNIPQKFSGSTTVRTEASAGTVGERTSTNITSVESTMNTYYDWMKIGEIASKSWTPGTGEVYAEQFAFAGAHAIDTILYTAAKTSTNTLKSTEKAAGTGTLAAGEKATVTDFKAISGFFYGQNARGFREMENCFVWIMHPAQETDLVTEYSTTAMSWHEVNQATETGFAQMQKINRMVGKFGSVVALRSTMIGTSVEDVTAYHSIALARYGIGWAGLGESGPTKPEIIHKRPGSQDTSQPANMYETIAWKVLGAERMLDAARVLVVYSSTT